jgi:hypothetical protein
MIVCLYPHFNGTVISKPLLCCEGRVGQGIEDLVTSIYTTWILEGAPYKTIPEMRGSILF